MEEFQRNSNSSDGYSSYCAACHNAATARWRAEHPEYEQAYNLRRRKRTSADRGEKPTATGSPFAR
jgi:hypothetical protein